MGGRLKSGIGIIKGIKGTGNLAGKGFGSFSALKNFLGSPGKDKVWHHIVEQSQIKKSGFSSTMINNTDNVITVDADIHRKISGYYSSKPDFTGGKTVMNWLAGQSLEEQKKFGKDVLRQYGVIE